MSKIPKSVEIDPVDRLGETDRVIVCKTHLIDLLNKVEGTKDDWEKCNISRSTFQRMMGRNGGVSLKTARRIAKALDVDVSHLAVPDESPTVRRPKGDIGQPVGPHDAVRIKRVTSENSTEFDQATDLMEDRFGNETLFRRQFAAMIHGTGDPWFSSLLVAKQDDDVIATLLTSALR